MAAQFYVRFIAPRRLRAARAYAGLFGPAYAASRAESVDGWLRAAIREEIDWFEGNLDVPARFGVVTRKSKRPFAGVCWFRPEAQDQIAHAYALKALLDLAGMPIAVTRSAAPGDIVWRDRAQVVAIPRREASLRWMN